MSDPNPGKSILSNPGKEVVRQFVIYAEHKVGWLNDFVSMLRDVDVHILAISVLDTSDSAVIRLIPNYPKDLARLLKSQMISFTERSVLAIELNDEDSLQQITHTLLRAEINIHYVYPFLHQPNGKSVVAIAMEDQVTAEEALFQNHISILNQEDFLR